MNFLNIIIFQSLVDNMRQLSGRIGIMQGRLSEPIEGRIQAFPESTWKKEFEIASKIGFELIEWVFDENLENPILTGEGINEIKHLSSKYNLLINSVCADYFMNNKLFGLPDSTIAKNMEILHKLIKQCHLLGIKILEIPFVDSSSIKRSSDRSQLIKNLSIAIPWAEQNGVYITLETDLPPGEFGELMKSLPSPNVRANYDIGNSTSLGYDPVEEINLLSSWIVNVHVKDRVLHGGTVPLGQGDANFEQFFGSLSDVNYSGDFIIQGAREDITNPLINPQTTCEKYLKFVRQYVDKYIKK